MALPLEVISGPFAEVAVVSDIWNAGCQTFSHINIAYLGKPSTACPDSTGGSREVVNGLSPLF